MMCNGKQVRVVNLITRTGTNRYGSKYSTWYSTISRNPTYIFEFE